MCAWHLPSSLGTQLTIVHQLSAPPLARSLLVEDRGLDGSDGYMEYLMSVHKAVQKMLYVSQGSGIFWAFLAIWGRFWQFLGHFRAIEGFGERGIESFRVH